MFIDHKNRKERYKKFVCSSYSFHFEMVFFGQLKPWKVNTFTKLYRNNYCVSSSIQNLIQFGLFTFFIRHLHISARIEVLFIQIYLFSFIVLAGIFTKQIFSTKTIWKSGWKLKLNSVIRFQKPKFSINI